MGRFSGLKLIPEKSPTLVSETMGHSANNLREVAITRKPLRLGLNTWSEWELEDESNEHRNTGIVYYGTGTPAIILSRDTKAVRLVVDCKTITVTPQQFTEWWQLYEPIHTRLF